MKNHGFERNWKVYLTKIMGLVCDDGEDTTEMPELLQRGQSCCRDARGAREIPEMPQRCQSCYRDARGARENMEEIEEI